MHYKFVDLPRSIKHEEFPPHLLQTPLPQSIEKIPLHLIHLSILPLPSVHYPILLPAHQDLFTAVSSYFKVTDLINNSHEPPVL